MCIRDRAWATFNMGLGMCLVVAPGSADAALEALRDAGAARVGAVEAGAGVRRA